MTKAHLCLFGVAVVAAGAYGLAEFVGGFGNSTRSGDLGEAARTLRQQRGMTPFEFPFEVRATAKTELESGLSCNDATDAVNAFEAYESVRIALETGNAPSAIEYLDCFLPAEEIVASPDETLSTLTRTVFDSNVMYAYLEMMFEDVLQRAARNITERKGDLAWASGHLGYAALAAHRSTGEKRYVDLYVSFFRKVMLLRDSQLGFYDEYHDRIMDSWGARNLDTGPVDQRKWVSHVTHFSVLMGSATAFAKLIRSDPALSEHTAFADDIVSYFKPAYLEFDVDLKSAEGTDEYWYWRPLKDKFEATNHLHVQGEALLNMYALTGEEFYADRIRWIIRVFERGVTIDANGLIAWNYHPYLQVENAMQDHNAVHYSERSWKAALTIPFLYQADAAGFEIDPRILKATTRTITDHVLAENGLASNLHPRGSMPIEALPGKIASHGRRASIALYLAAAVDDPQIAKQVLDVVVSRRDIYPQGWFAQERLARGYAYFLGAQPETLSNP